MICLVITLLRKPRPAMRHRFGFDRTGERVLRRIYHRSVLYTFSSAFTVMRNTPVVRAVCFSQMYFVYLKKKARNQGANFPGDAAGKLRGVALERSRKK